MNVHRMFKERFDKYTAMIEKYPKAAKKRRVLRKWRNRFDPRFSEIYLTGDLLCNDLLKEEQSGKHIVIGDWHVPWGSKK